MTVAKEKGNLRLTGISTDNILRLIQVRHSGDVVVPQCKNGQTWGVRDLLKMDAWVLCRSYSPLRTIGYEIKVSRQDFERDQKWTGYLDLCHEFYFACPAGLIRATDLPQRVGIVWASKEKLFTKRKAESVEPDIQKLANLLIYIVMARSQIVANMYDRDATPQPSRFESLRNYLELAEQKKELAYFVKGHVRRMYDEVMSIHRTLEGREQNIANFRAALEKLGIIWNPEGNFWTEQMKVENAIREMKKNIDEHTVRDMRNLARSLTTAADSLEKLI